MSNGMDDLFAQAPHNGTRTSREAADSVSWQVNRLELLVLRGLIGLGDATREELEELEENLGLTGNCVRPRIWSLMTQKGTPGYVEVVKDANDKPVTRMTKGGRRADVLRATKRGFDAAAAANGGYANEVKGKAA